MYCPQCQAHNPDQSPSCLSCGYTFGTASIHPAKNPKRFVVGLVIVVAFIGLMGISAFVFLAVKITKEVIAAASGIGPTFTSLPGPDGRSYSVTDMGEINAYPGYGIANSSDGHVVSETANWRESDSYLQVWDSRTHNFKKHNVGDEFNAPLAINDSGEIIYIDGGSFDFWQTGTMGRGRVTPLLAFDGSADVYASEITNDGVMPGAAQMSSNKFPACEWSTRSPKPIRVSTGVPDTFNFQELQYVNERGDLIIWAMRHGKYGYVSRGYLLQGKRTEPLGTLSSFSNVVPNSVNNGDQIVGNMFTKTTGYGEDDHLDRAFFWKNGGISFLGTDGHKYSEANSLNDSSEVVGSCYDKSLIMNDARAYLWLNGKPFDLNRLLPPGSPWLLEYATQINNSGQIVGFGSYNGEASHGFVLTPR
jgi:hypothetical protein